MPITFSSNDISFRLSPKKKHVDWLLLVAFLHQRVIDTLHFEFCSDQFLFNLNRKYLSHNTLTDILTFDYSEKLQITADIFISIDRVADNSKQYNVSFNEELRRVMVHGFLHCCGYHDKNAAEKKRMRREENKALQLFGHANSI